MSFLLMGEIFLSREILVDTTPAVGRGGLPHSYQLKTQQRTPFHHVSVIGVEVEWNQALTSLPSVGSIAHGMSSPANGGAPYVRTTP